jgi:hypothetical protein
MKDKLNFLSMSSSRFINGLKYFLLILILMSLNSGCYYYRVSTETVLKPEDLRWADFNKKYFILHSGDLAWHLNEPKFQDERFSGYITQLPDSRLQYKNCDPEHLNRYKKESWNFIDDQLHLYAKDSLLSNLNAGGSVTIEYSDIEKIETYQRAQAPTRASKAVPAIGIPLIAVGILATIVALTKSSCPLVYIKNNKEFKFAGEIFGGAVYSSLERHDYMPMPGFWPENNQYILKITNGLPEIQYINLAELWIVSHPDNVSVLPDRYGTIHLISDPVLPVTALAASGDDILYQLRDKDTLTYHFDENPSITGDTCAFNSVCLFLPVPEKAGTGKLVIKAGNSMWGDYIYGEFTKFFGNKYGEWIKKQGREPAEKYNRWKVDQRFALLVYLETELGWQFVDYFDLIGPLGARELVMPIDISSALINESPDYSRTVRIKLESGFKFWDIDYAAIDFTEDMAYNTDTIQPMSVSTETGYNVTPALTQNDSLYYIQETIGEEGLVIFMDSPDRDNMTKSVFLHTKGYYEHVRNYPGPPDKKQLQTFLVPGRFSKFSFDRYVEFTKNNWVFAEYPKLP